jgi:hypothetical protein
MVPVKYRRLALIYESRYWVSQAGEVFGMTMWKMVGVVMSMARFLRVGQV